MPRILQLRCHCGNKLQALATSGCFLAQKRSDMAVGLFDVKNGSRSFLVRGHAWLLRSSLLTLRFHKFHWKRTCAEKACSPVTRLVASHLSLPAARILYSAQNSEVCIACGTQAPEFMTAELRLLQFVFQLLSSVLQVGLSQEPCICVRGPALVTAVTYGGSLFQSFQFSLAVGADTLGKGPVKSWQ